MAKFIFTLICIVLVSNLRAQSQCPSGMIPGQGGCYSPVGGNSYQNSEGPIWENRYGAVAASNDPENNTIGTATSQLSQSDAIDIALNKCGKDCEVWFTVVNSCMALAVGKDDRYHTFPGIGRSKRKAEKEALAICQDNGLNDCKAKFSSCSLPERSF